VSLKDIDTLLNADESTLRQAIADSRRVDERTRHFWRDYDHDSAHQTSAIALRRKLVSLFHEPIATLFASHAFTWRELLAQPRIVFIDLSQIGSPAKETVAELTLAEIGVEINRRGYGSRETIPYHLYLDAFTDFMRAGASTHELLTKGRKNGLGLTLTHQSHAELPDSLEGVIMGNVKTLIIMRVNDQDAHVYARALQQDSQGSVTPSLLQNLQMGQAIVRLEVDGVPHCVAVQMPRFK
jgi:hypothetical protein